ncbi:MAG TPA: RDD family protein [Propionicimonas sp.]|nr:RDD family protein [Propionicimonas sp.]
MTQIPAGWYPDPDPNQSQPGGQRGWDGQRWTEHVQAAAGAGAPAPQGPQGAVGYPQAGASAYPQAAQYGVPAEVATTPDGEPLAGWWRRVGAFLIDGLIVTPVTLLLGAPWLGQIMEATADFVNESVESAEAGAPPADQAELMAALFGPLFALSVVAVLVTFAYHVGFLTWKAATPGKLLLGMRVRLRETPGPLSVGTAVKRWAGQFGYLVLSAVPVLGNIASFYPILDGLWPLWDSKKQAVHDKIARTNVVLTRR